MCSVIVLPANHGSAPVGDAKLAMHIPELTRPINTDVAQKTDIPNCCNYYLHSSEAG
jgi:hypothetical protein